MPSYLHQQLHFDVKHAGIVALLPYLASFVCGNIGGYAADTMLRRGMTTVTVRKVMVGVSELVPALVVGSAGFVRNDPALVVALLTVGVGASGCCVGGWASNHRDIAPHFAGMLYGISNTFAAVPGIVAPVVVGYIVNDRYGDPGPWQSAFLLSAAIAGLGFVVFAVCAKGEQLPELSAV